MGLRLIAVTVGFLVAACLPDNLVTCSDGRVCPGGTACDVVHATCVTPTQTTACESLIDGDRCDAGSVSGICDTNVCLPGCGDGTQDALEECDDGNFVSHDGCSSSCAREQPGWTRWTSPWLPRHAHVTGYLAASRSLVVVGGVQGSGLLDDQWQRSDDGVWTRFTGSRPPPRRDAMLTYDSTRGRLILFGGKDAQGNAFGDTWEFNGVVWNRQTLATSPPARSSAAMVFDASRARVVLYGGFGAALYDDTWEYDGTTWTPTVVAPAARPPARLAHSMVWDALRNRVVLFGGSYGLGASSDTWEYNAGVWMQVLTSMAPSARANSAMAYSAELQKVVLFGGRDGIVTGDTWQYDAVGWQQVTTGQVSPRARAGATLTSDRTGSLVLVAGAGDGGSPLDDVWRYASPDIGGAARWVEQGPQMDPGPRTSPLVYDVTTRTSILAAGLSPGLAPDSWSFNGSAWERGANLPIQRFFHSLAYDEGRRRAVLFGGYGFSFGATQDTFERDSETGTWTMVFPAASPSRRSDSALAYDPSSQRIVLFGGVDNSGTLDDTWEYDGSTWTELQPTEHPPRQSHPSFAYDRRNARMILFSTNAKTWAYKDHEWSRLPLPPTGPIGRDGVSLAYDAARGRVVMFGGAGGDYTSETWELDDDAWTRVDVIGLAPEPRARAGLAYDLKQHAFVLCGGANTTGNFADTWLLQYHSVTPDEQCDNRVDDDGDRHVDDLDPDCL